MGFFAVFFPSLALSPQKTPPAMDGKPFYGILGVLRLHLEVWDSLGQNSVIIFPGLIRIPWITKGWHPWADGGTASRISGDAGSISLDKILNPPEFHGPRCGSSAGAEVRWFQKLVSNIRIGIKYWEYYQMLGIISNIGIGIQYWDCYQRIFPCQNSQS